MTLTLALKANVFKVTEVEGEDKRTHDKFTYYRAICEQDGEAVTLTCSKEAAADIRVGQENVMECTLDMGERIKFRIVSVCPPKAPKQEGK